MNNVKTYYQIIEGKIIIFLELNKKNRCMGILKNNYIDKSIPFDNERLKILAEKEWNKMYPNDNNFKASTGWCTNFKK
jgi:hypothetical protein